MMMIMMMMMIVLMMIHDDDDYDLGSVSQLSSAVKIHTAAHDALEVGDGDDDDSDDGHEDDDDDHDNQENRHNCGAAMTVMNILTNKFSDRIYCIIVLQLSE